MVVAARARRVRVKRERSMRRPAKRARCSRPRPASSSITRTARGSATTSTCAASISTTARASRCASATFPSTSRLHIHGQGYADANFIIPEVVRSIRVLEGPYDPRQGDAAIVGSAYFDLGVPERGYQLKTTYGSFDQARVVGIVAPDERDDETFAAFALRKTDGFGQNRASQSASMNAQYGVDLGRRDHLRLLATAYGARAVAPGRRAPGRRRRGPHRLLRLVPDISHRTRACSRTGHRRRRLRSRDAAAARASSSRPGSCGPIFDARKLHGRSRQLADQPDVRRPRRPVRDDERSRPPRASRRASQRRRASSARGSRSSPSPGDDLRVGHTDQTKSLLDPVDSHRVGSAHRRRPEHARRRRATSISICASASASRLGRPAGGPARRRRRRSPHADGRARRRDVVVGPRVTAEYEATRGFALSASYGEGFRSLDARTSRGRRAVLEGALRGGGTAGARQKETIG